MRYVVWYWAEGKLKASEPTADFWKALDWYATHNSLCIGETYDNTW